MSVNDLDMFVLMKKEEIGWFCFGSHGINFFKRLTDIGKTLIADSRQ